MSDEFAIRTARADDIAPLNDLIGSSVRGLAPGFYTPEQIDSSLVYMFGVDTQLVRDGTYFVIEHESGVRVACGGWSGRQTLFGGDNHKEIDHANDLVIDVTLPARIRAFFVHPDWARRGLARRLYEHCASEARAAGFGAFELMGTLPGVPLYRTLGFETIETVSVPLPDGVQIPCERMRRTL